MSINMTQALVFETDCLKSFEKMLRVAVEVMFDKDPGQYVQLHLKAAPWHWEDGSTYEDGKRTTPTRVWVTTLADYKSGMEDDDESCPSQEAMVEMVMQKLRVLDFETLKERCGDGYNDWFNHFDGSTGVGYRMHREPNGGWNELYVSLTHAYYGK